MAIDSIALMFQNVKRDDTADFTDVPVGVSPELLEREQFCSVNMVLGPTIFHGSMTKARDLVNAIGGAIFVPHTNYTTLEAIADFYGVRVEYLKNLFVKYGVIYKKMPFDVLHISGREVSEALKKFDDVCVRCEDQNPHRSCYSFSRKQMCNVNKVFVPRKGVPCFYSARVVLAAASLMHYGSLVPKESKASKVVEMLQYSSYYERAKAVVEQNNRRAKENKQKTAVETEQEKRPEPGDVRVAATGEFIIPPEVFVQVIKVAVKEAVSDAMTTFASNFPQSLSKGG